VVAHRALRHSQRPGDRARARPPLLNTLIAIRDSWSRFPSIPGVQRRPHRSASSGGAARNTTCRLGPILAWRSTRGDGYTPEARRWTLGIRSSRNLLLARTLFRACKCACPSQGTGLGLRTSRFSQRGEASHMAGNLTSTFERAIGRVTGTIILIWILESLCLAQITTAPFDNPGFVDGRREAVLDSLYLRSSRLVTLSRRRPADGSGDIGISQTFNCPDQAIVHPRCRISMFVS
jgi:hypothetical protein